ncbi:HTH-type transcriptional repressor PurR [compost metagenome]
MVKKGHTDIGVICGSLNSIPARLRFNGYYRAVSEFLLPIKPELIKIGDWEAESGCRLAKELFGLPQRPTAIMAMNDVMAAGVIQAATESDLCIPEDVSLVGFDNREFSAYLIPNLTTMDLPLHEMGMQAMEVLSDLIEGIEEGKQVEQPLCKMIERGSVASPNLMSR